MVAVLDRLGCDSVAILGLGVPVGVLFAATHPRRTRALVLADASVRYRRANDYRAGWSDREIDERIEAVRNGGLVGSPQLMAPSLSEDLAFQRWFNRAGRLHCTPGDRVWRIRHRRPHRSTGGRTRPPEPSACLTNRRRPPRRLRFRLSRPG
jgi:pimeloyl-ACP methyl ester carboxylesterase